MSAAIYKYSINFISNYHCTDELIQYFSLRLVNYFVQCGEPRITSMKQQNLFSQITIIKLRNKKFSRFLFKFKLKIRHTYSRTIPLSYDNYLYYVVLIVVKPLLQNSFSIMKIGFPSFLIFNFNLNK